MQLHRDDSHHSARGDLHDRAHAPLDCVGMKAALSAYLDDELTRAERFEADSHLVGCANCRALVERAEPLDRTLRSALDAAIALAVDPIRPSTPPTPRASISPRPKTTTERASLSTTTTTATITNSNEADDIDRP